MKCRCRAGPFSYPTENDDTKTMGKRRSFIPPTENLFLPPECRNNFSSSRSTEKYPKALNNNNSNDDNNNGLPRFDDDGDDEADGNDVKKYILW